MPQLVVDPIRATEPDVRDIHLPPTRSALVNLVTAIDGFAQEYDLHPQDVFRLNLVLDELFTNAVEYGQLPQDSSVHISLERDDCDTIARICDNGVAFDPLQSPPPDLTSSLEHRPIGGMGIHFLKTFMQECRYQRLNDQNQLTFRQRDSAKTGGSDANPTQPNQ